MRAERASRAAPRMAVPWPRPAGALLAVVAGAALLAAAQAVEFPIAWTRQAPGTSELTPVNAVPGDVLAFSWSTGAPSLQQSTGGARRGGPGRARKRREESGASRGPQLRHRRARHSAPALPWGLT